PWPADDVTVEVDPETMRALPPLPSCPACGSLARPHTLTFGDADRVPDRAAEQLRAHPARRREPHAAGGPPPVSAIGPGAAVPTVRREPELSSAASGALVRINTREPAVRHGRGVAIARPAAEVLTEPAALVEG